MNNSASGEADPSASGTSRTRESRGSLLRFIVVLLFIAWALRCFVFAPFSIPSGSMLPTLYIGDYLVVAKWPYGYSRYSFLWQVPSFDGRILGQLPERGDVVVFRHPTGNFDLIKRVIGLPGDTVEVRGGVLVLNGRPVKREALPPVAVPISANSPCKVPPGARAIVARTRDGPHCLYPAYRETLPGGPSYTILDQLAAGPGDNVAPTRVPPGRLFLMGDNRDDSADSRFEPFENGIGLVPTENLIGRAQTTFWSTDGGASYFLPWTWFTALRANRIGSGYTDAAR